MAMALRGGAAASLARRGTTGRGRAGRFALEEMLGALSGEPFDARTAATWYWWRIALCGTEREGSTHQARPPGYRQRSRSASSVSLAARSSAASAPRTPKDLDERLPEIVVDLSTAAQEG
jgi:hypothetical protein